MAFSPLPPSPSRPASVLEGGQARAALSCTFGSPANCYLPETNLSFSNFTYSGDGVDVSDAIQIQGISATSYAISFNAGGTGGNFDSNASINFTLSGLNGYSLLNAAAASTMAPGTPFVFSYASSDLSSSPITTSGSQSAVVPFNSSPTTADFVLSWSAGNNVAQGTAFYIQLTRTEVPAPLPFAGAAAAFVASRRLRSRIRANQI